MPIAELLQEYVREVEREFRTGRATEHSYRPALKQLIENACVGVTAVNDPRREECGAPDYVVLGVGQPIGYIETKDIDKDIAHEEKSEQLTRYRHSLENLILTNFVDFRWYLKGELVKEVRLGQLSVSRHLSLDPAAIEGLESMLSGFSSIAPRPITTPLELSKRMAQSAAMIREVVVQSFERGLASDLLKDIRSGMARILLPGLERPESTGLFADTYSQTLVYGLFAAWAYHRGGSFTRTGAARDIPKTNPFLRRLFDTITGVEIEDEPYLPFVDDLVHVLGISDSSAVLAEFGAGIPRRDPLVHFYETFLAEYNPRLRRQRGVYYTPVQVADFIVRSADELLRLKLGVPSGLSDASKVTFIRRRFVDESGQPVPERSRDSAELSHRVLILDPACGTGGFLYSVVELVRNKFVQEGNAGLWRGYVKDHLIPRLFGFEILMAPYAVAHLKLALQLSGHDLPSPAPADLSYDFADGDRIGVFLTNTLDEPERVWEGLLGTSRILSAEAKAASEIKSELPIMVIVGNPPYNPNTRESLNRDWEEVPSNGGRTTRQPNFIGRMLHDYYAVDGAPIDEANPRWLRDDYVKFIRWGEWRINRTGRGVLAFITNRGYLENPTFRGMRNHLLRSFDSIHILDLHGDSRIRETGPGGTIDENVFDIRKGVAIAFFVRTGTEDNATHVYHKEVFGSREHKLRFLENGSIERIDWEEFEPKGPLYLYKPQDLAAAEEFGRGVALPDVFPLFSSGILTARDSLTVAFTEAELWERIEAFLRLRPEDARQEFNLGDDARDWKVSQAQTDLRESGPDRSKIRRMLYRPFDWRFTYYTGHSRGFHTNPRSEVMANLIDKANLALISARTNKSPTADHFYCSDCPSEAKAGEATTQSSVFPLYLYPEGGNRTRQTRLSWSAGAGGRVPNLSIDFVKVIEKATELTFLSDGHGDLKTGFGPDDLFEFAYAAFHSTRYRTKFGPLLHSEYPRVPIPASREHFVRLCGIGKNLVALHLLSGVDLDLSAPTFPMGGSDVVGHGYPRFISPGGNPPDGSVPLQAGRVYINATQHFLGVSEDSWNFTIGGYQVCEKWLKDRTDRRLTYDDISHYRKVVYAIDRTRALIRELDAFLSG